MSDTMNSEQRSERMSLVKHKRTQPEKVVRSLLHRLGYRFRLHAANLPGRPDIVLPRHRKAIFIHRCFWHRHGVCYKLSIPTNNAALWAAKFRDNVRRDAEKAAACCPPGWAVHVVWECETKDTDSLRSSLLTFMQGPDEPTPTPVWGLITATARREPPRRLTPGSRR